MTPDEIIEEAIRLMRGGAISPTRVKEIGLELVYWADGIILSCPIHKNRNNAECYDCGEIGCEFCYYTCGYAVSAGSGEQLPACPRRICNKCGSKCKTCEIVYCDDHIVERCHQCDGPLCKDDYQECENCRLPMCVDHQENCEVCESEQYCDECVQQCPNCNLNYCPTLVPDDGCHFICDLCQQELCVNCVPLGPQGTRYCKCENMPCPDCRRICEKCGEIVCDQEESCSCEMKRYLRRFRY